MKGKRFISLLLALVLCVGMLPMTASAAGSSGSCGYDATWKFDSTTGELTVSGTGDMFDYSTTKAAPWFDFAGQIKKVVVNGVGIGNYAFSDCNNLTTVKLSGDVNKIGDYAFWYCGNITTINLRGATKVGKCAFVGCGKLQEVFFYSGSLQVTNGTNEYASFDAETATLYTVRPQNLSGYTSGTWNGYTLKPLEECNKCGDSLTWSVSKIENAQVNGDAYKLVISGTGDMYDFGGTDNQHWRKYNQHYHSGNGCGFGDYITEIVIESGVTHIGSSAFAAFCEVEKIVIPEGVTSIGAFAFQYYTSITEVELPLSLATIDGQGNTTSNVKYCGCVHQWNKIDGNGKNAWTSVVQCKPNTNRDDGDCTTALLCSVCGGVDIAARDGHSFTNYVSDNNATCMADGTKTAHCDADGCTAIDTVTDVGSKKAHSFTNYVSDNNATCMADGTKTAHCDADGCTAIDTVTDVGSKKAHDFSNNAEACRNGCGTKNPAYVTPIVPPAPIKPEKPASSFDDINEEDYFFDAVLWAAENGITEGTSPTTFAPDDVCTRAEMVTFLWRSAGKPEPVSRNHPFTDVSEKDYFYQAVLWAVENGITKGMSATTFGPNDTCTRAHAATFLYRYAGAPAVDSKNPFVDVHEADYSYDAVLWAAERGITKGTSTNTFSPEDFCIRAQIVTFLYRYQQN